MFTQKCARVVKIKTIVKGRKNKDSVPVIKYLDKFEMPLTENPGYQYRTMKLKNHKYLVHSQRQDGPYIDYKVFNQKKRLMRKVKSSDHSANRPLLHSGADAHKLVKDPLFK